MALLGIALPNLQGSQVGIDLFPEPPKLSRKAARALVSQQFEEFLVLRLRQLDQRDLWECFQRVLRISVARCLDDNICQNLLGLSYEDITPPRNRFLYKAHYWLLDDLASDAEVSALDILVGAELDADDPSFLLRLSFSVYRLFEQLMCDLADHSAVIKEEVKGARVTSDSVLPELGRYKAFISQVSP